MTSEQEIKNPSVTLYPFHVRDDFDEGYQQVAKNAKDLWENFVSIGASFNIKELKELRQKLICYDKDEKYNPASEDSQRSDGLLRQQDGKTVETLPFHSADAPHLSGSVSPLRLHDIYTADLTLSYTDITVKVADLSKFNPQGCLLPDKIQTSLGQTLLLYAEPVNVLYKDYPTLADACVKAFVQDKVQPTPKCINEGRLFGSPIFEYDNREVNPAKRCHILVWLKRHPETLKLVTADFNYYLLNLLCYRSKIIFAYNKATEWHREAQRIATAIEKEIPAFKKIEDEPNPEICLKQLKDLLARIRTNLFNYTDCLRNLRECHNTVTTNTQNYAESLSEIWKWSREADNLTFLQNFLDLSHNKFQAQIQVDLNYLISSQDLFKEMIDTIRGMVEILAEEQAQVREQKDKERDRNLQTTIAVVGVGIGFTGLAAASFPYLIPPDPKTTPIPLQPPFTSTSLHPFISVLVLSLIFGFVGAGVAKVVTILISPRSDQRAKLKSSTNNKLLNQANTPEVGQVTGAQQKVEFPTQPLRK
jgi:hypothetical protein